MIKKIKDKLLFIIPVLLILYFILNLLGGNRGLFSYFEKRNYLTDLKNEEKLIKNKKLSTAVGDEGGFSPMINKN